MSLPRLKIEFGVWYCFICKMICFVGSIVSLSPDKLNSCVHIRPQQDTEGTNLWFLTQAIVKVWNTASYPLLRSRRLNCSSPTSLCCNNSLRKVSSRPGLMYTQRLRSKSRTRLWMPIAGRLGYRFSIWTLNREMWNNPGWQQRTETLHFAWSELESYNAKGLSTDLYECLNHRLEME